MPALFSNVTLGAILLVYFLASAITSIVSTNRNYPTDEYTNWIMMGGLTSEGASFRIRRSPNDSIRRFVIATDEEFITIVDNQEVRVSTSSASVTNSTSTNINDEDDLFVSSITISGLESNKGYFYATWDDQDSVLQQGHFTTAPRTGQPSPFKFATAGCAWSGSIHEIFSVIAQEENLLFFLHLGYVVQWLAKATSWEGRVILFPT
jgi:hypothetical protein